MQPTVDDIPSEDLTPAVVSVLNALQAENVRLKKEIQKAQTKYADLERLADRDPLVSVLNRRAFLREFSRIKSFVERYGAEASLIFIDLNNFKQINDRFGHKTGDVALQMVADILKGNVRESDVVGRLGGDEFGVILVNADLDVATDKAQILSADIQASDLTQDGRQLALSASLGVWPIDPTTDLDTILARADAAMYRNKRQQKGG